MDTLKWILFFCVLTLTAAANLRKFTIRNYLTLEYQGEFNLYSLPACIALSESSEENYVDGDATDDDGSVVDGESIIDVEICTLPPVNYSANQRHCSGFIPRWYYNAQSSSCKKFFWDGCWGTRNLFRNEFACLARCNKQGTHVFLL